MHNIINFLQKYQQQIRFLFVGGLLFSIDFSASVSIYYFFSISPGLASAIGFFLSFIVGFTLNKKMVFKHVAKSKFSVNFQVLLYLSLAIFNLVLTSFLVELAVDSGMKIEVVKPAIIIVMAFWNYNIMNKYIFGVSRIQ